MTLATGRQRARRWAAVVLAFAAAAVMAPAAAPPAGAQSVEWTLIPLQPAPGKNSVQLHDANEVGVAVGSSSTLAVQADTIPVAWDRDGNVYPLPLPPGFEFGTAYAINDHGVVAGTGLDLGEEANVEASIVWRPGQDPLVLDGEDQFDSVPVTVLNTNPATVVTASGRLYVIGGGEVQLPGAGSGAAIGVLDAQRINGIGVAVGHQASETDGQRAALWTDTGMHLLAPTWEHDTNAPAIAGYVVGMQYELDDETGGCSAAAINIGGTVMPLDPAASSSELYDVTSFGIALGGRRTAGCGPPTAGVLYVYGTPVPLHELVGRSQPVLAYEVTEQLFIWSTQFLIRPAD